MGSAQPFQARLNDLQGQKTPIRRWEPSAQGMPTWDFFISESTQFLSSKSKALVRHRMLCLQVRLCHYRKLCQMQGNQFSWSGLEWHWADGLNQHNWIKHNKLNTTKCSFSPWNFPRCAREIYYHSVLPENETKARVRTQVEGCHFFSSGAQ